jgi:hypothetical protein
VSNLLCVLLGQVSESDHIFAPGWSEAGKTVPRWSQQLWNHKAEELPRSAPTNFPEVGPLFPIAWHAVQMAIISQTGSSFPRERLLPGKIISRRPLPRSVARKLRQHCYLIGMQHVVLHINSRKLCNQQAVFDSFCHVIPQSHVAWRLSAISGLQVLTPAIFGATVYPHSNYQVYRTLVGRSWCRLCQGLAKRVVLRVLSKGWRG